MDSKNAEKRFAGNINPRTKGKLCNCWHKVGLKNVNVSMKL